MKQVSFQVRFFLQKTGLAVLSLAAFLAFSTCSKPPPAADTAPETDKPETGKKAPVMPVSPLAEDFTGGLLFTMVPGSGVTGAQGVVPHAPGTPLPDAETQALLKKLPPLPEDPSLQKDFAFRDRSLPPPRTGAVVQTAFPPPPRPAPEIDDPDGDVEILRHSPTTDVYIAPNISVTFNQPMVAITSHADSIASGVPVKIHPEVPGKWRWLGTRTLVFESELERLPKSTRYTVTVAQGIKSARGRTLPKEYSWEFSTPTLQVETFYPPSQAPQKLNPVLFVRFDQRVDPAAVLATMEMKSGNDVQVPLKLANEADLDRDESVRAMVEYGKKQFENRFFAFVPVQELDPATTYTVTIGPGTPSLEGNEKTETALAHSFKTYDPLAIIRQNCERHRACRPPWSMVLTFNNPLDEEKFKPEWVKVSPEIPNMDVSARGNNLVISGRIQGRRTYQVRVDPELADTFGQTLGKEQERDFVYREADPGLHHTYQTLTVADPSSKAEVRFSSINIPRIRVRAYRVTPQDYRKYMEFSRVYRWDPKAPPPPGKLVHEKTYTFDTKSDEMVETVHSLEKYVNAAGNGQLMVIVGSDPVPERRYEWHTFVTWIQFTRLAVDAHMDHQTLLGLVTKIADGSPVSDVTVEISGGPSAKTDKTGLARIQLPVTLEDSLGQVLLARTDNDLVMLPKTSHSWGYSGQYVTTGRPRAGLRAFTFDDRKLYKPKETVRVKGYLREVDMGPESRLSLPSGGEGREIRFTVHDPRNNKIGEGSARINQLGGFSFQFDLPDNTNLGDGRVEMVAAGYSFSHRFTIAEFRRPEFEVQIQAGEGPFLLGSGTELTLAASYFSGGGLPGAEVNWNVNAHPGHFSPPGWFGWQFGNQAMRWWFIEDDEDGPRSTNTNRHLSGATDTRGQHSVRLDFLDAQPKQPYAVTAHASVVDVNRQSWTANRSLLVHPSSLYAGLKTPKYFVPENTPMVVELAVTDIDGQKIGNHPAQITAELEEWKYQRGKIRRVTSGKQTCNVNTSAEGTATCTFQTPKGGSLLITATVTDAAGRVNTTRITRYVEGGSLPPVRKVERERLQMILDREGYRPGDTAEVFIQAPFYPAEGLWFRRHAGISEPQRFRMEGPTHILRVPVRDIHMPGTEIQVELTGANFRQDDAGRVLDKIPKRAAYAGGTIHIPVSLDSRKLELSITPAQAQLSPGGKTRVSMLVKNAANKPVANAEIALVAVDEAVLALTGYRLQDPLYTFYPSRAGGVSSRWLREHVQLMDPVKLDSDDAQQEPEAMMEVSDMPTAGAVRPSAAAPGAKRAKMSLARADSSEMAKEETSTRSSDTSPDAAVQVRSDFSALALWAPEVLTDAAGKAEVELKLPDNLTRYRLMAVVVSEATHYGLGEASVTARLPIQLRPSPPRFLNFGDRLELPLVVQNQTEKTQEIRVAITGRNVNWTGPTGQKITVPAQDRREVRFAMSTHMAGTAKFSAIAQGETGNDAATFELPVWTPATTEGFASYGTLDKGATVQPVQVPSNVVTQFGGLQVQTSSTALQALTDAVLYLYNYPFECSEQIASRILSVAALRDVLAAFQAAGMPKPEVIEAAMAKDIRQLAGMQNSDGGFAFWIRGMESWPFLTIHVTHALLRAREKGYTVPENLLNRALGYLRVIERHIPPWYPEWVKRSIIAYSLFVRNVAKDPDPKKAAELYPHFAGGKQPDLEGVGYLYPVFVSAKRDDILVQIRKLLMNRITETAGNAHFVTYASDGAHLILHSARRVDGLLLSGLMLDQPRSDLIPKIVAGLLAHRKQGRWANTQESAWVLLALDQYFRTYEKVTPNFISRVWLGEQFAGEHRFAGRTTERHTIDIPMNLLGDPGKTSDLIIDRQGAGRLYYRIGMNYALSDLRPPAASHGFTVSRRYSGLDRPEDVKQLSDGTWEIKAGSRVKVTLTMLAPARRYHVALVDPLPAGLEAENAALRGTAPAAATSGSTSRGPIHHRGRGRVSIDTGYAPHWWRMWGRWYEHHNIRDERVEAFASLLDAGVHTFEYTARATTPGHFIVPPLKAEEMYAPETFGRSTGDHVRVVE